MERLHNASEDVIPGRGFVLLRNTAAVAQGDGRNGGAVNDSDNITGNGFILLRNRGAGRTESHKDERDLVEPTLPLAQTCTNDSASANSMAANSLLSSSQKDELNHVRHRGLQPRGLGSGTLPSARVSNTFVRFSGNGID